MRASAGTDWDHVRQELDRYGCALTGPLLTPAEAENIKEIYKDDARFRATIDMARHRFGEGEYRYFREPLPEPVAGLRQALYPRLLPVARDWWGRLGRDVPWPDSLGEWLAMCHAAGQARPAPLLLKYGEGDWNALHRDLYGDLVFPLQVVIGLNQPGDEFTGGEFVVVEQRPRAQSRATATEIPRGHALVFTTRDRPIRTKRGWSKCADASRSEHRAPRRSANARSGVSRREMIAAFPHFGEHDGVRLRVPGRGEPDGRARPR
jgi:uncharacterized protein